MKVKLIVFFIFCISISMAQTLTDHWDKTNYGFTGRILTPQEDQVNILQGSKIIATDVHVYYIGFDMRIYDLARNGNEWESYDSPLVGSQTPLISRTQLVNNGDKLYYV